MAGPIGYGVAEGMRRAREKGEGHRPRPPSWTGSWLRFVGITVGLSWITAAAIGGSIRDVESPLMRLFWASLYYVAVMGWQPLLGAWLSRWAHHGARRPPGLRSARVADVVLAVGLAAGLAIVAMIVARLLGEPATPVGAVEASLAGEVAAAATGIFVVLCLQAITEEYGWRGFPLSCAIEQWGPRRGLVIHGIAWGAWYAPLFLVASTDPRASATIAGAFVITCMLLGIILGWLRLRSGSLLPSAVANAVLTMMAGLPVLLHEGSAGALDAVFRLPGWPVLALVAFLVLLWGRLERV